VPFALGSRRETHSVHQGSGELHLRHNDDWLIATGFIYGPRGDLFYEGVGPSVARLNQQYDGATWLEPIRVSSVSLFFYFTDDGVSWDGPVESPQPAAKVRRTRGSELWVSSYVPTDDVRSRTDADRVTFWDSFLDDVLDRVGSKRSLADYRAFSR
jgi:hypothetical protein